MGGQKRLDRRYKERKVWLPRGYFQVYFKERNWEPDPRDRVAAAEAATSAAKDFPALQVAPLAVARRPRVAKGA